MTIMDEQGCQAPSSMKLLAMDTATTSMSVALLEGSVLRKEINSHAERNHSIYLLPHVKEALQELGWSAQELQGIAVGRGPGSYTGVRIGVTVAKTMAWALGLPVVGVSSLEAMAAGGLEAWEGRTETVGEVIGAVGAGMSEETAGVQGAGKSEETAGVLETGMARQAVGAEGARKSQGNEVADGMGKRPGSVELGGKRDGASNPGRVWLVPLMNARRGQVYTAWFAMDCGQGESQGQSLSRSRGDESAEFYPISCPEWNRLEDDGIRLLDHWLDRLLERMKGSGSGEAGQGAEAADGFETSGKAADQGVPRTHAAVEMPAGRAGDGDAVLSAVLFIGEIEDFEEPLGRFRDSAADLGVQTIVLSYGLQGRYIGLLGQKALAEGVSDEVHRLLPNYTQLAEAEANLLKKNR